MPVTDTADDRPMECPRCGQVAKGREIGKLTNPTANYIWHACIDCGKERWTRFDNEEPRRLYCRSCGIRRTKWGARNPNWKGDDANPHQGRHRCKRLYPNIHACVECGALNAIRHHIDHNPLNNDPQNIMWLCHSHHGQIHNKTHCPHGHPYDAQNTWYRSNGKRQCRACHNEQQKRYHREKKWMKQLTGA